jgi:signal transduction histidine kinase
MFFSPNALPATSCTQVWGYTPYSLQAAKAYCKPRPDHRLYKPPKDFNQSKKPLLGIHTIILMHAERSRLFRVLQAPQVISRGERLVFACGILLALASLLWWHMVWLAVVFLLLTLCAGFLAVRGANPDARETRAMNHSSVPHLGGAAEEPGQYWTDWLSGWYWQTDAQFRLTLLKPPVESPASDWAAAQALTEHSPALWDLCRANNPAQPVGRGLEAGSQAPADGLDTPSHQLQTQLRSGGQLRVKGLPWPLPLAQDVPAVTSSLMGQPRLDATGRCLGHHGVWAPDAPSLSARLLEPSVVALPRAPVLTLVEASPEPRRSEDEINQAAQESLRFALSHDLRAPLRVVDGFARILKEDYGPSMDRIGKDHLERILSATVRMNGMIDAVLDQARLSQAPLQLVRVNVSAMVRDIATELLVGMRPDGDNAASHLRPQVMVADELWHLADEVLLRRVLENLLGNALKYSAKVAQARIEFGAVPATNPTVFFVKDNGAGFDMKHADKLFGLFQRLHSAREFQGTGVGLASVQNIIRRHGGRVWAEGATGEGACFYFTLASFGSAGAHPPAAPGHAAAG